MLSWRKYASRLPLDQSVGPFCYEQHSKTLAPVIHKQQVLKFLLILVWAQSKESCAFTHEESDDKK